MNGINESWETLDIKITGIGGPLSSEHENCLWKCEYPQSFLFNCCLRSKSFNGILSAGKNDVFDFFEGRGGAGMVYKYGQ